MPKRSYGPIKEIRTNKVPVGEGRKPTGSTILGKDKKKKEIYSWTSILYAFQLLQNQVYSNGHSH
tara:strand:+ start:597 stop:791 length:195 start_codon:yes stop_codon:yes gene_type:complete